MSNYPEEEYWRSRAMQLASASVVPMVMQAVVDLGVLDIISRSATSLEEKGGVSADEIASQLELTGDAKTSSSMLDRMLCLLASHSILTCTISNTTNNNKRRSRLYSLSPIAKYFIPNSDGISLGPAMSLAHDKVITVSWAELKPAVLQGSIPFNRVHRMPLYEYLGKDPRFSDVFNKAMINRTAIAIGVILDSYKGFEQVYQVVDVGGGLGFTLKLITSKYPHIKGINFDLQHVIQHAPHYPGVEHVAGDMFENVPTGDVIFMKSILHNWNDEHCSKLLRICYKALPENGKVIVVDKLLSEEVPDATPSSQETFQIDVIMMMNHSPGGRERTEQEFLSLATAAGFSGVRFECSVCNFSVMELYK